MVCTALGQIPAGAEAELPQERSMLPSRSNSKTVGAGVVRARDQINGGFVQYVHAEDLALGEKVATTGACGTCHGADYKGVGDVPRLAGQHTVYLIRQLKDIQSGARKDKNAALMKPIVAKLSDREMVAVAA
jgi:cytochrome c553